MSSRTRIVFITGMGRSGSTILELLLAQLDGWVAGGELRRYWLGSSTPGWICGCGRLVEECEFWMDVRSRLRDAGIGPETYGRLLDVQRSHLRLRPVPVARLMRGARRSALTGSPLNEYQRATASLYSAVAGAAGARVVVDSSKQPQDAYLATWNPGVEIFAIHLVRDPRGVAHSFSKRIAEPQPDLDYMPRSGPLGTAIRWSVRQGFIEMLVKRRLGSRCIQLRYEDVVRDPLAAISRVAAHVSGSPAGLNGADGTRIEVMANHTFSGNPLRLRKGTVEVRPDEAWATEMARRDQALAALAAAPLMGRYGYTRGPR
jgi:Sulfotransferase family